jgi:hypothetical protein
MHTRQVFMNVSSNVLIGHWLNFSSQERAGTDFVFGEKTHWKATLPPKSGENGLFFEKQNAKIEPVLKLFGESVATGMPVDDSFNGQIIKLSPFMSHFDLGFSPPLLLFRFEKNKPGTDSFEVEQFICHLQINMHVH